MKLEDLLELLEIKSTSEFEYFENMANLIECEEHISDEALYLLFSGARGEALTELIKNYFEEVLESIPDDSMEIYTLIENIKRLLTGLIQRNTDDERILKFTEEFSKFRQWYSFDSKVECVSIINNEEKTLPLRDALTMARIDELEKEEHRYDFMECLDYEIDDYMMEMAELVEMNHDGGDEALLDNGYVYDDEL